MNAKEQTHAMLEWWRRAGVERADLAVHRADGVMIWHRSRALERLPLGWARAENIRSAEIYVRAARGEAWPLAFLDDVATQLALRIAREYSALAVETSPVGGCHLWLACQRPLEESERAFAQRWLAQRTGADPASTSGEHLGRLAGFRNWKRSGVWVNLVAASWLESWDPTPALVEASPPVLKRRPLLSRPGAGPDRSPSGLEWGWVCGLLELGCDSEEVYQRLVARARKRRGRDAERYARRTVDRAAHQVVAGTG
ncbi:MAG: hypothetical protein GY719_30235 [bacterium]|nr:hypothetical protein [bacterium]